MKSRISSLAVSYAVGCLIASIPLAFAGTTPLKKDAKVSLAPGAAIHAKQQHLSVGIGDLYLKGKFARYLFRNGEANILFRSKDAQV